MYIATAFFKSSIVRTVLDVDVEDLRAQANISCPHRILYLIPTSLINFADLEKGSHNLLLGVDDGVQTLRTQDTSTPVPNCPHDTLALVLTVLSYFGITCLALSAQFCYNYQ